MATPQRGEKIHCCGFTPMTTVVYDTSSVRPATQFLPRPGHPSPLRAGHANPAPPRPRTQREGCPRHVMNTCPDLAHPPLSTSPIQAPRAHNNNNNTAKAVPKPIQVTAPLTLCAHNNHDGDRYLNHDRHVMTACSHGYPGITSTVVDITRWQKIAMVSGGRGDSKVTTTGGSDGSSGGDTLHCCEIYHNSTQFLRVLQDTVLVIDIKCDNRSEEGPSGPPNF
ncbi:hypothetical protein EDB85DRAFT_2171003 [Lactarius pseudohatsudake]|nr:hypothetical protein EDB85DRAFT_2171003 [Lactarius pseudohatsudake]